MMKRRLCARFAAISAIGAIGWICSASSGLAADSATRCESRKLREAGKYGICRLTAVAKSAKRGISPDYSKCETTFASKWRKAEEKAGPGVCPTEGDRTLMDTRVTTFATEVVTALAVDGFCAVTDCDDGIPCTDDSCDEASDTCVNVPVDCEFVCGNGVIDPAEQCDGAALKGASCESLGLADGRLACAPSCQLDVSGCGNSGDPSRFVSLGNRTAFDRISGLTWELKDDSGGVHDKDNRYTWTTTDQSLECTKGAPDGTVFTTFLDTLNNKCDGDESTPCTVNQHCVGIGNELCGHAGHRDWRLPTLLEMKYLLQEPSSNGSCTSSPDPCVDPDFPGEYGHSLHWTSATYSQFPYFVWMVDLRNGDVLFGCKDAGGPGNAGWWARAVRGARPQVPPAVCHDPAIALPASITCSVGTTCLVPLSLDPAIETISSISGALATGGAATCSGTCTSGTSAPPGSVCSVDASCNWFAGDIAPPLDTFVAGEAAVLEIECVAESESAICLEDLVANSVDGLPIGLCPGGCTQLSCAP